MGRVAYVNGRYLSMHRACVNVEDRGYQFGDGIYEVIFLHCGTPVYANLHFARLERSLSELRLAWPMSRAALQRVLLEVAHRNHVRTGLIYVQITRGVSRRAHGFPMVPVKPSVVVTAISTPPVPGRIEDWTINAITYPEHRWARCDIKTTNLLPNVLARQAARERGAHEAILVDRDGMVTEAASANVWIVDAHGALRTRPLGPEILPGCTRAALIALLRSEGVPLQERAFSKDEMHAAREVFVTSASSFVKSVLRIDDAPVAGGGVGELTRRLFNRMLGDVAEGRALPG